MDSIPDTTERPTSSESLASDGVMPIAIVGIGFRGPGDASDLNGLWNMIANKREARSSIPKDRWNNEAFYHPDSNRSGTTNVTAGNFMKHDVSKFDASFFHITRSEAEALDPQQRILLECSYEAFENAAIPLEKVAGSNTCCFVGSFCGDYTDMLCRDTETLPFYQATSSGHSRAITANRLSYFFDLHGPSATIDSACSASLVALHLACQSLRTGETKQALVCGANIILSHEMAISMSMMRFLSPDGRCYSFDERANGYARGEGASCVVLKPLADAIRDGDPIRAVIRNTGSNQDGKTPGLTLPSRESQEELIQSVYAQANLDPTETAFVECHGPGTPAGDPVEAAAIANVFTKTRRPDDLLRIGSIKTNIGHLEGASGIAGLIKTILMLERRKILPNRNFERPNKRIPFAEWKLKVPTELEDFAPTGPIVASVNSFGFGGSNAHAIIQDVTSVLDNMKPLTKRSSLDDTNGDSSAYIDGVNASKFKTEAHEEGTAPPTRIFHISAPQEDALQRQTRSIALFLQEYKTENEANFLHDLAYTLSDRKTRYPVGTTIHASSKLDLVSALMSKITSSNPSMKTASVGYVFTGQGAQWWGMGRELFSRFPVFDQNITIAAETILSLGAGWDLRDEMRRDAQTTRVNEAQISQPACTALQIALVDLLASWSIKPDAVTGHSSGELAAAYCAGGLTAKDAISAAYHRGRMSEVVKQRCPTPGGMMAVGLSEEEVIPLLANLSSGKVVVACVNSDKSITASGDAVALDELKVMLDKLNVFSRKLTVEVAYHSHHMACVADDYLAAISHIKPVDDLTPRSCIFYSSVTGKEASLDQLGPEYWVSNVLSQVKFGSSLREMCESPLRTKEKKDSSRFINALCEIGPHSALAGPSRQIMASSEQLRDRPPTMLSCLVRNKNAETTMADTVCTLSKNGVSLDISAFNSSAYLLSLRTPKALTCLPPYRWNHEETYWAEPRISKEYRLRPYSRSDILGVPVIPFNPKEPRWRNIVRVGEMPWVKDHRVQESVVYPAAGFLAMSLEVMVQESKEFHMDVTAFELKEVTIGQALVIPADTGEVEIILSTRPFGVSVRFPSETWKEFSISSVSPDNRWTEHSRGLVRAIKPSKPNTVSTPSHSVKGHDDVADFITKIHGKATIDISPENFYAELGKLGLDYGPMFSNVKSIQSGKGVAKSIIHIADTASMMPSRFEYPFAIHPSTLDSLFHPIFAALGVGSTGLQDPYVPIQIDRLVMSAKMRTTARLELDAWTEAVALDNRQVSAKTVVFDEGTSSQYPVLQIDGLVCMKIAREERTLGELDQASSCYQTKWLADIDMMTDTDIRLLCQDLESTSREEKMIESFEEVGHVLMKQAFDHITELDVESAKPHHKRLYSCMKTRLAEHRFSGAMNEDNMEERINRVKESGAEGALLVHIGSNLVPIIQGHTDALILMLEEGRLDAYYRDNSRFDRNYKQAAKYFDLAGHKNPNMSILEIGSGTGGATLPTLQALTDNQTGLIRCSNFTFTDISTGFFEAARQKLEPWRGLLTYAKLDIEINPVDQGFDAGTYDVILAANVLHATKSMKNTMRNVRKLLRPGGKLVLVELTRERFTTSTIFGTLPGWFAGEKDGRVHGPTLTEDKWDVVLQEAGFNGLDIAVSDTRFEAHHQGSMMVGTAAPQLQDPDSKTKSVHQEVSVLIIHEDVQDEKGLVDDLTMWLTSQGEAASTANMASCEPAGKICVVLSGFSGSIFFKPSSNQFDKIKAIFSMAKAVIWVTRGSSIHPTNPASSMVTGFARTVRSESGNIPIVTLDLDPASTTEYDENSPAHAVKTILEKHFLRSTLKISTQTLEHEYAERSGTILIPRLVADKSFNQSVNYLLDPAASEMVPFDQPGRHLVVDVGAPGLLDTIRFIDDARLNSGLPEDVVEINVKASGLNFKDVMMALGQVSVETLGAECSGIVARIGSKVHNISVGDRVSCYGFGTIANVVRQDAAAVQRIPSDMSFELGAALPVTFCTAYYSVVHVARIQSGQSVLIHAASGGLGQALIELCKLRGAETFCTVGTAEKKNLLMDNYGIREDHILNSRDTSFAATLMRMTQGRGVDVIMNSMAGEMLRVTWDCIAPFGIFVELGARDYTINSRLEMARFARNTTFAAVNFASVIRERPHVAATVWADVMDMFREGKLKGPTPLQAYGISELEETLRLMQSGKHLGKLVLVHDGTDMVKATPRICSSSTKLFQPDATYLIIGGMGGIGRAIAHWMLEQGARNLVFASRSGKDHPEARKLATSLEAAGARVVVGKCDVSKIADLELLMEESSYLPPVKGVLQCAMVLQDSLLANMQLSDYEAVLLPKVQGTWNLHNFFKKDKLDFFVMLSSISGIIGIASQAAYAAASSFLDSFALFRRSLGLAASTIDLGVITGIGYVAENQNLAAALERQGFQGTSKERFFAQLHSAILAGAPGSELSSSHTHGSVHQLKGHFVTGLGVWRENSLAAYDRPLFSHFRRIGLINAGKGRNVAQENSTKSMSVRELLKSARKLDEATSVICNRLTVKISSLSMIPVEDIGTDRPLSEYGMDSLVAVEMRNWIGREMDATIPILELMANEPLHQLASNILAKSSLVNIPNCSA